MLKMKANCEKCGARTGLLDKACICSYECTFCEPCAEAMNRVCPNCGGELARRPTRAKGPIAVVASRAAKSLRGKA